LPPIKPLYSISKLLFSHSKYKNISLFSFCLCPRSCLPGFVAESYEGKGKTPLGHPPKTSILPSPRQPPENMHKVKSAIFPRGPGAFEKALLKGFLKLLR